MAPDTLGDRLHFSPEELLVRVEVLTAGKSLMHLRGEIFSASAPERLCVSATAVYAFMLLFLQNDLSGRPPGPPHPARKKVKKGIDIFLILC